jgi:hypothetical protein
MRNATRPESAFRISQVAEVALCLRAAVDWLHSDARIAWNTERTVGQAVQAVARKRRWT